ncbi:zinc-finger domain-containing protein [Niallia oryzisoli]|uniref:zinc-finger domain-containing protein n=1 Tax=Niallia oryzisoli TaxID=1737571 RepID=UPI003735C05B
MERKKIINEVESIMNNYCNGCFLYKQNRKDRGRNFAHRFCISTCTVGLKIKQCGEQLTQEK